MVNQIGMALALALALAAACGDGDGGGQSGVDGDLTLDEISDAEATELCEWGAELIEGIDYVRFACYAAAIAVTDNRDACEALARDCLDEPPAEVPDPELPTECELGEDLPACAGLVTVDEIERCATATVDQLGDLIDSIDCDTAVDEVLDIEPPAACEDLRAKCPELFDDDEEDEEDGASSFTRGIRI